MAIRVKHGGGDIGGLAALAALAGSMQARIPQAQLPTPTGQRGSPGGGGGGRGMFASVDRAKALRAAAGMQKQRIDAAAKAQMLAADQAMAKTAVASGLSREFKEQEYELEVKKLREQAKIEAEQWETKYTAQQRQEIQRWNNADAAVEASDDFSEVERAAWRRKSAIGRSGIKPSQIPADPNKPKFAEGQAPGQIYEGEKGGMFTTTIGPSGQPEPKLMLRPDQMQGYMEEEYRLKSEAAVVARQQESDDQRLEAKLELFKEKVDVFDKLGGKTGVRGLNPEEIKERSEMIDRLYGIEPVVEQGNWWDAAEKRGEVITEADKALPPQVGYAQSVLRKYPNPQLVPDDERPAYNEALRIYMEAIEAQRGGR